MKKLISLVFTCVFIMVVFSTLAFAEDKVKSDNGVYIGIGGSYVEPQFNCEGCEGCGGYEGTSGFNLKLGYQFNRVVSLEFVYDSLSNFELSGSEGRETYEGTLAVQTFMAAFKIALFNSSFVKPFVVVGLGLMEADEKIEGSYYRGRSYSYTYENEVKASGICGKVGFGIDFVVAPNCGFGLECAYIEGAGDIENVDYVKSTVGINIYF